MYGQVQATDARHFQLWFGCGALSSHGVGLCIRGCSLGFKHRELSAVCGEYGVPSVAVLPGRSSIAVSGLWDRVVWSGVASGMDSSRRSGSGAV